MKQCSYVASLESKLEKLEKRLAALDSRRGSILPDELDTSTNGRTESTAAAAATTAGPFYCPRTIRRQKLEDDSEIEDLVADLGYMSDCLGFLAVLAIY